MSSSKPTIEDRVIEQLEQANQSLPDRVKADIAYTRRKAILQAQQESNGKNRSGSSFPTLTWATPAALAALVTLYVSYSPTQIPELPAELLDEEIPAVNVALLQDLDFANWLAEQDDEALL